MDTTNQSPPSPPPSSSFWIKIRWTLKNIILPILLAIVATAGFSEIMLNIFSLWFQKEPNWAGATYQPADSSGEKFDYYYDSWKMEDSSGRINAIITKDDPGSKSKWKAQGYRHNRTITAAYRTEIEGKIGIGSFYLSQIGNEDEYRGYQVNFDCDTSKTYACPYVLMPSAARSSLKDSERTKYLSQGCALLFAPPPPKDSCPKKINQNIQSKN